MDYGAIRKQILALSRWLALDMEKALERLDDLEGVELQPFGYSESPENDELELIERSFQQIWNPVFVALLTEFAPYRDLISLRRENESFTLDFSNWYRLFHQQKRDSYEGRATSEYRQFLGRLKTGEKPLGESQLHSLRSEIEEHKQNLAFTVVFQRAYFLAFREWIMVDDAHLDDLGMFYDDDVFEEDEEPIEQEELSEKRQRDVEDHGEGEDAATNGLASQAAQRAREYVECLNVLVEKVPEFLELECIFEPEDKDRQRFWLGSLLTAEGAIDFTQGASVRAKEILFWAVAMQMYDGRVEPEKHSEFDDFWTEVLEAEASFTRRIYRSVRRFSEKESSAAGRILAARGDGFTADRSREEAVDRMRWLWKALEL